MPMKIPADAKIVTDNRLTIIRILSLLTAKNGYLDKVKNAVKASMKLRDATFAQSDLALARLQKSEPRSFADPRLLYELVKNNRITHEQFMDVLCVRSSLLPEILSGAEIHEISKPGGAEAGEDAGAALYTEFKPDVRVDVAAIEDAILKALKPPAETKTTGSKSTGANARGGKSAA